VLTTPAANFATGTAGVVDRWQIKGTDPDPGGPKTYVFLSGTLHGRSRKRLLKCSILNSVLPWMHFHGFSLFLKEFNCVQIPGTWANFQILHPTPTVLALRNGLPSYKFLIKSRTF
jgi:hypothetical protein